MGSFSQDCHPPRPPPPASDPSDHLASRDQRFQLLQTDLLRLGSFARAAYRAQVETLTFTSLLKDIIKSTEEPDKEMHRMSLGGS